MTQSYFVTGTDTEVGKTAVACALLEAAQSARAKDRRHQTGSGRL